jgi:hypothetical protein
MNINSSFLTPSQAQAMAMGTKISMIFMNMG